MPSVNRIKDWGYFSTRLSLSSIRAKFSYFITRSGLCLSVLLQGQTSMAEQPVSSWVNQRLKKKNSMQGHYQIHLIYLMYLLFLSIQWKPMDSNGVWFPNFFKISTYVSQNKMSDRFGTTQGWENYYFNFGWSISFTAEQSVVSRQSIYSECVMHGC